MTDRHRQQRLEQLFDRALAQPPELRLTWLRSACPDDDALRAEVADLLAHAETLVDGPLARPPVRPGPAGRRLTDPEAIGPYRIIGRIGEGTFGVVYEVEQTVPLQRRLALKLLKPGMDTETILARFAAERRTLAMLDHPNIARVIDAGATGDGRPYFVMELVRGESLTRYCDGMNLGVRERLELLLTVCRAVKYAHQRGVLHRDLKPSNILVALVDGRPLVKVIDFGIAKATVPGNGLDPVATLLGEVVGTPSYMSPEQAAASRLGVDTATDVYSLGVILHELLCGVLPHGPEIFRDRTPAEFQLLIRDTIPPPPSERLRPVDDAVRTIAAVRNSDPAGLRDRLRGDLDWITLRAIEADRRRRYQTTQDLIQEIERHFADLPVLAGPPTARYRLRKFVRRNRSALGVAALLTLALLIAAGALSYSVVTADRERALAEAAREESDSVLTFLSETLGAARPSEEGRDVTVVEVLDQASDSIGERFADRPRVAARMQLVIGQVQRDLGRYDAAVEHIERALVLHRELDLPTDDALEQLGYLQRALRRYAAAESTFTHLVRDFRGRDPVPEAELLSALVDLGSVYMLHDQSEEALAVLTEAEALLNAGAPASPELRSGLLSYLGAVVGDRGEFARADSLLQEVLALDRDRLGEHHPNVVAHMQTLASVRRDWGRPEAAIPLYRRSLELAREIYGDDHPVTLSCRNNLAIGLADADRPAEALEPAREVVRQREAMLGPDSPSALASRVNLASILLELDEATAAEDMARETRARAALTLGTDHRYTIITDGHIGRALLAQGDAPAALSYLESCVAAYERVEPEGSWRIGSALTNLGRCQLALGDHAAAEASLSRAHRLLEAAVGAQDDRTREAAAALADCYEQTGRVAAAERLRERGEVAR